MRPPCEHDGLALCDHLGGGEIASAATLAATLVAAAKQSSFSLPTSLTVADLAGCFAGPYYETVAASKITETLAETNRQNHGVPCVGSATYV